MQPEQRIYTRHPLAIRVSMRFGSNWVELTTADASRRGLFVRTETFVPEQQIVQLRIELPGARKLELMGRVRRVAHDATEHPLGPGMGIEFFAIAKEQQATWDEFIRDVRRGRAPDDAVVENSQVLRDLLPTPEVREMLRRMREAGEMVSPGQPPGHPPGQAVPPVARARQPDLAATQPGNDDPAGENTEAAPAPWSASAVPAPADRPVTVTVRAANPARLEALIERCLRGATVFLRTPVPCRLGHALRVALVHPETDAEFVIAATVMRVVTDEFGHFAGVQAQFAELDLSATGRLLAFAEGAEPASPGDL